MYEVREGCSYSTSATMDNKLSKNQTILFTLNNQNYEI